MQIFLSNGSGVCTDFQRCILKIEKLGRECSACSLCTAKCSMGIDFTKRNKLQVESALRASSALAGARKEMRILELNMEW